MEIKAKCKFDLKTMQAFMRFLMFKKANPKKRIITWSVIFFVLFLIIIWETIVFGAQSTMFIMLVIVIFVELLGFYMYFILPKIKYNSMGAMKDNVSEYIFCDNSVKVISTSEESKGQTEFQYSTISKIYETSEYFFIFSQINNQVFIVDKSTVEKGAREEIKKKFIDIACEKYIQCKY